MVTALYHQHDTKFFIILLVPEKVLKSLLNGKMEIGMLNSKPDVCFTSTIVQR